jgi:hypothetical protein
MSKMIRLTVAVSLGLSAFVVGCNGNNNVNVVQNPIVHPRPIFPVDPNPICPAWGCNGPEPIIIYYTPNSTGSTASTGSSGASSIVGSTKDTDLQRAESQEMGFDGRVQSIATEFQVSINAATQLAQLGDTVRELTANGQTLTADDRTAITNTALNIAGVTGDDINQAVTLSLKGDNSATDALLSKAAGNLGMPSTAALRDKLLPSFGVNLN